MDAKNLVVMYTFSPFPIGEATSNRIFALALSIKAAGFQVIILSNGPGRSEDYDPIAGRYSYRSIEYRNYADSRAGKLARTMRRNNIGAIVEKHLSPDEKSRIACVYLTYRNYGLWQHCALKYILRYPAVVDVTEWHSSGQFLWGRLNPAFWLHDWRIRHLVPRAGNVICITTFLDKYFRQRGCNTVIIPPQVMVDNYRQHEDSQLPPVRLFYAGTAAKKDYLDVMLDGLALLDASELKKVLCTMVGTSLETFRQQFPRAQYYIDTMQESLQIVARVPKTEVDRMLAGMHFLILMRPKSRYSDAGFPSKVPEALAAGVPVISNLTSDLAIYLQDMQNGIIVEEFSAISFAEAIRKAIRINTSDFQRMSALAARTAAERFDYRVHREAIREFLSKADAKVRKG